MERITRSEQINGLRMGWFETGPEDGPPVVLLHALGQSFREWEPIADALASAGHRVVAPNFRGHASTAFTSHYSFEAMRDDVVALLDHLGIGPVALIGHSMGGTVAYIIAEAAPSRVRKLIIEDTPPPGGPRLPAPNPGRARPAFVPTAEPFDVALLEPIGRQLAVPDPSWWDRLRDITCPALLIGGGSESPIDQGALGAVAEQIADCRVVTLGGGHYVHANRPVEFANQVIAFLAEP